MTLARFLLPRKIALFGLISLLSACTADVGPNYWRPPPRAPSPQICTLEYNPVCGQRGGRVQTFANACQARANNFTIINRGQCRRPPPMTSRPTPLPSRPQVCTMEYAPVCGQRSGRVQTFSNACQAQAANFTVISRGQCRRQPGITVRPQRPPPPRPGGICTREYRPVCGQRGSQLRTFSNTCEANNSGFRIIRQGACR